MAAANHHETPPVFVMLDMIFGHFFTQGIYVAAKLGLADRLLDGHAGQRAEQPAGRQLTFSDRKNKMFGSEEDAYAWLLSFDLPAS